MNNPEAIIVGAGPVGLVAALVLAQAGVHVTVLEKRDQLNQASKASTFHPPTLAILDRLGTFGPFQADARHVGSIQYRTTDRGVLGDISYDLLAGLTTHPFRKHLEQSRLTALLLERLRSQPGVELRFNTGLDAIVANDADGVVLRVDNDGRTETLKTRFVLGTDGAHSQVRQSIGIDFESTAYSGRILRARADESLQSLIPGMAPVTYLVGDTHSASFLHMPDCWRIILRMDAGTDDETAMSDDWIFERLIALVPRMEALPHLIGRDIYGASKAIASQNRVGNVYLCGDSAHLTNTRGGMNMNAGIHDAYTMARAIVRAIQDGDVQGLASASNKRLQIARDMLLPRTDTMVSKEGSWIERVSKLLEHPDLARDHLTTSSMLDMVNLEA